MDISKISDFIAYKPVLDKTPDQVFKEILSSKSASYISDEQKELIIKAYKYAKKHHKDQNRLSGEPYIIHPLKVVHFLLYIKPGVSSIQAALLHDLIEDTKLTQEDISKEFGEDVAGLCDGLVKVSKVRYRGEDRQLETLKKTFLAMGKDLRVIIIKIADRVHNIQTLHYHPSTQKRSRIAEETLKIYVPIAKRLGLYVFQGFLENGAFYQLRPKEYQRIYEYVIKNYGDVDTYRNAGIQRLEYLCESEGVAYKKILGRLKSPFRIYKKLLKYQTQDVSKIMDILAFRIITDDISSCYNVLGIIHKHYTPIFSKMKDYISIPKPNGYKSLHTTVLGMFDFPTEIQVRTSEMDHIANYGIAAHFAYSDDDIPKEVPKAQAKWIEKLQDIVNRYSEASNKEDFKNELDIEILQKNIFVYTPKGDIIEMPIGSSILDFAFRVHTDLGLKFKNGYTNGKIVPIDYKLKTGDIVKIDTFKNKYTATKSRLKSLHTPSAKSKLQRHIRQQEKDIIIEKYESVLNKRLEKYNLPLIGSKEDRLRKRYNQDEYEQILFRIRDKQLTPTKLIKKLYDDLLPKVEQEVIQKQQETIQTLSQKVDREIIVDGNRFANMKMCPECVPKFPEKIIAKTGKDGIKIHKLTCKAFSSIDYTKLIEAHWKGQAQNEYTYSIELEAMDKAGILLQLLRILDYLGINVKYINASEGEVEGITHIDLQLVFSNPSKIGFLLEELKQKKKFIKIRSSKLS